MTNAQIKEKLTQVVTALNGVSCSGMSNLLKLGGSIGILNDVIRDFPADDAEFGNEKGE